MRIVAGRFKGRTIVAPPGRNTRPTSDRARQALFDVLVHAPWAGAIQGAKVVDLFAGSGGLGLEALSRGAGSCLFVETDEVARGALRENIDALGLFGETRIHRRDAADLGVRHTSAGGPFDLAFLDPPYGKGLGEACIKALLKGRWLSDAALIVFERSSDEPPFQLDDIEVMDERSWGAANVVFLKPSSCA